MLRHLLHQQYLRVFWSFSTFLFLASLFPSPQHFHLYMGHETTMSPHLSSQNSSSSSVSSSDLPLICMLSSLTCFLILILAFSLVFSCYFSFKNLWDSLFILKTYPGLHLGWGNDYPDGNVLWFFLAPPGRFQNSILN